MLGNSVSLFGENPRSSERGYLKIIGGILGEFRFSSKVPP